MLQASRSVSKSLSGVDIVTDFKSVNLPSLMQSAVDIFNFKVIYCGLLNKFILLLVILLINRQLNKFTGVKFVRFIILCKINLLYLN